MTEVLLRKTEVSPCTVRVPPTNGSGIRVVTHPNTPHWPFLLSGSGFFMSFRQEERKIKRILKIDYGSAIYFPF